VTLWQEEREVGNALALAGDAGALAVLLVLDQARGPNDVLGHAFAPLTATVGAGERLAQALRRGREVLGDLGVGAQRLVDLAESL
jgi:hypothetical protein